MDSTRAAPVRTAIRTIGYLLPISRPTLWPVTMIPAYAGYVLATQRFLPQECAPPQAACVGSAAPLLSTLFVVGPCSWLVAFALNDWIDLPGDLVNPRKAGSPLVRDRVRPEQVRAIALVAALITLLAAAAIGPVVLSVTAVWIVVAWIYSVPPLRLKDRPGWDVASNALAIGFLPVLAGWSLGGDVADFPWLIALVGTCTMVAIYAPTTIADYDSDKTIGYRTTAIRFGKRKTYLLGLTALIVSCALNVILPAVNYVIPQGMIAVQVIAAPTTVVAYHLLIGRAKSQAGVWRGIVVVGTLISITIALFVLMYVGWI